MADTDWKTSGAEIEAIVSGHHGDPFKLLGLHQAGKAFVVRAFVPGAQSLEVMTEAGKSLGQLGRRHDAGFFEGEVKLKERQPLRYLAANSGGTWTVADAYLLGPVLGPLDDYYIGEARKSRTALKKTAGPSLPKTIPCRPNGSTRCWSPSLVMRS